MKQRIKEILKELWETHIEFRESRPESEKGYLTLGYNTLFSEAVSCYRGEKAGENKKSNYNSNKPATAKQIAYAQQLADKKKITVNLSEKSTSQEVSKLIKELQQ